MRDVALRCNRHWEVELKGVLQPISKKAGVCETTDGDVIIGMCSSADGEADWKHSRKFVGYSDSCNSSERNTTRELRHLRLSTTCHLRFPMYLQRLNLVVSHSLCSSRVSSRFADKALPAQTAVAVACSFVPPIPSPTCVPFI
jgi:hypothetical protein